jgi:hypothetical protein
MKIAKRKNKQNLCKIARNVLLAVLFSSFGNQQILALSEIDSVATVYNFEVENTHTYVVGNAQL